MSNVVVKSLFEALVPGPLSASNCARCWAAVGGTQRPHLFLFDCVINQSLPGRSCRGGDQDQVSSGIII